MTAAQTPHQDTDAGSRTELLSRERQRPPAEVAGYTLERFLGRGTFGEVWVALDRTTGYRVAIKFFFSRGGLDWSLLAREVDKLRALKGDRYVVQLEDVGWNADPPYFVMEYVEQGSLEEWLQKGPLGVEEALPLFRDIAVGLSHAHNKGILHCDLKPANILLDQDGSPRLADFGQARLTEEHSPALGTWFYMAPEQANLSTEPDTRWDVYALGVVLYRMLTGQTPYQTEEIEADLKKSGTLEERLARYRKTIAKAPPATAHRRVPGMDRALADLLDRCLMRDPTRRFPSVQAVLAALDARALAKAGRPLLVLGALGPLLLLLVMSLAAWGLISATTAEATREVSQRTQAGNRIVAQLAAQQVAAKIQERWDILTREASRPELLPLLASARDPHASKEVQARLQQWLDHSRDRYTFRNIDSTWFLTDAQGKMLAVNPLDKGQRSLHRFFWNRDYFHGRGFDMLPGDRPRPDVKPIQEPHLSVVFRSTGEGNPRLVVFSVPILVQAAPGGPGPHEPARTHVEGVLAMGVQLGEFTELKTNAMVTRGLPKVVTLVQTRHDSTAEGARPDRVNNEGLVLEHGRLREVQEGRERAPEFYLPAELTAQLRRLREARRGQSREQPADDTLALIDHYRDPLGETYRDYAGTWLAAAEPVLFRTRKVVDGHPTQETVPFDPGWVVLAQEPSRSVTAPVEQIRGRLFWLVILAMAVVVGVVVVLWGLVIVGFTQASRSRLSRFLRKRAGLSAGAAPKTVPSALALRSTAGARVSPVSPAPATPHDERRPEPDVRRPGPATPRGG